MSLFFHSHLLFIDIDPQPGYPFLMKGGTDS